MSTQKVIFRADAGKAIGFGHFVRSLALAEYLRDYYNCFFCSFNPTDLQLSEYQLREISKTCKHLDIKATSFEEFNTKFLELLKGDEIVVLDNYYFNTDYQNKIKKCGCKLVCIDDIHDRHFVADAVITGCPIDKSLFSLENYTMFCSGIKHSFLRRPFLDASIYENRHPRPIKNVAIAIGGSDPYGLTNKILHIFEKLCPHLTISVIAGDTVNIDPKFVNKTNIYQRVGAEEIVNIFSNADLGVFSASTICVEALACSLPVAAGWYVDNQKEFYEYGVKHRLFMPLGNFLDPEESLIDRIESAIRSDKITKTDHIDFAEGKRDIINLFKQLCDRHS